MFGTSKISSKNPIYSDKSGRFSFRTRALDEAQELYEKVH